MEVVQMVTERQVVADCLTFLRLMRFKPIRFSTGVFQRNGRWIKSGSRGTADIIACAPDGRFVAVECKRPGGKLSVWQKHFLDEIRGNGGVALVVCSVDELCEKLLMQGYKA